jgi:nucleotide-binding universal stress UspA family protein
MFKKILVTLENGPADATILPHAKRLAKQFGSELLLLDAADGWAARNFHQLKLAESEEMKEDRAYLERLTDELGAENMIVTAELEPGNPPAEILRIAEREHCDLIAMASHGHRFLGGLFHGSTISKVRHETAIPLLMVRALKR